MLNCPWTKKSTTLEPLFKSNSGKNIPAPEVDTEAPLQMLVNTLDYDDYVGRIVVGRVIRGTIHNGENITLMDESGNRAGKNRSSVHISRLETCRS